ncbi:MAG: hypothetical protein CVU71_17860, partial [Deltaproteobacteria bacterium HGW-Deltaproteobacteria-6]
MGFQQRRNRPGLAAVVLLLLFIGFAGIAPAARADQGNTAPAASPAFLQKLTADERAWLAAHPVIRVVQDPGWPPVEFADEKGEFVGMAGDYLALIEEMLNMKFERIRGLTWQEAYARLKRGDIDMTTSVAVTPEREKFWAFTRPYMKIPIVIVAHADVTYLDGMHELEGKKVAVVDGYAVTDWIPRDFPTVQLVRVKTVEEGLKALQRGDVFAYIDNMLVVGYYMAKLKMANLKIAGETPYVNAQSMAVRLDWAPLAGILQKALDSISQTQRNDIYRKWLPIRYEHGFDYTLLWYALAVFAIILLGMGAWNWKLFREIAFRKKAEAALRRSEEKFRLVFEAASVGKSITLPTGEINVNKAYCDMLGYAEDEMRNMKWQDVTPPEDIDAIQSHLNLLLNGEQDSIRFIKRYLHKNGSYIWADISVAIQRDRQREPLFFITTIVDISERIKAEENMRLAYDRVRRFMDSNIVGMIIAEASGKVLEANDYYLNLIGFARRDFESGKVDWRAITPPEWLQADEKAIAALGKLEAGTSYEKEYIRPDGTRVPILITLTRLPGPDEQIAAFILDITDRKLKEQELLEKEVQYRNLANAGLALIWT